MDLLFAEKNADLTETGIIRTLYDPTAGTGGMLSLAEEHLLAQNPDARLTLYGQEYNPQSYAICKSDLLAKGHDATNIAFGNTLTHDAFTSRRFDFCMSNPPYGVDWKQYAKAITKERDESGPYGRFAPGLPATSDGQRSSTAPRHPRRWPRRASTPCYEHGLIRIEVFADSTVDMNAAAAMVHAHRGRQSSGDPRWACQLAGMFAAEKQLKAQIPHVIRTLH